MIYNNLLYIQIVGLESCVFNYIRQVLHEDTLMMLNSAEIELSNAYSIIPKGSPENVLSIAKVQDDIIDIIWKQMQIDIEDFIYQIEQYTRDCFYQDDDKDWAVEIFDTPEFMKKLKKIIDELIYKSRVNTSVYDGIISGVKYSIENYMNEIMYK